MTGSAAAPRRGEPPGPPLHVTPKARARLKGHGAAVVWLTGLSGAGKSTIAECTERRLCVLGVHTMVLDADILRRGLNADLGYTEDDRAENVRRVAEVATLMADAGLVVLVACISPSRAERRLARELAGPLRFVEVHVDTPLAVAEARDPKGLYARARRGELANFTGIDSPYERPETPELRVDTTSVSPDRAADALIAALRERGVLSD